MVVSQKDSRSSMRELAYIRKDGKFLIASMNRPWKTSGGEDSPSNTERGLAKKCDMHAYYNLLETHLISYLAMGFHTFTMRLNVSGVRKKSLALSKSVLVTLRPIHSFPFGSVWSVS